MSSFIRQNSAKSLESSIYESEYLSDSVKNEEQQHQVPKFEESKVAKSLVLSSQQISSQSEE